MAQRYKLDVLYGAKVINPVLAARICPSPSRWQRLLDGLHYWLIYRPAHRFGAWRLRRHMGAPRLLAVLAMLTTSCAAHRVNVVQPTSEKEYHALAEAQRFAGLLGVKVRAVMTTSVYMVPASRPDYPGEKVPAGGWYGNGSIKFWRPVILERGLDYGTALAAHEVCHVKHHSEQSADTCAAELMAR